MRKRLTEHEAILLGKEVKKKEGTRNAKYSISESENVILNNYRNKLNDRSFVETIVKKDKNGDVVLTVEKLQSEPIEVPEGFEIIKISTSKTTGQQWVQYKPIIDQESELQKIDFDTILSKYISVNVSKKELKHKIVDFDRLVYSDTHVGMTPNENGYSLYGGIWNEDQLNETLDQIVNHVIINKKSNHLIIDDLGDFMDGWDGETVRKGHKLPQNMDNEKAFDVGLSFKVNLIDRLSSHFDGFSCNNICNDNHSGSFGYVVNSAFKSIMKTRNYVIDVNNIRKFIDHYIVGNNCFILSHGKDGKNLKFGFKPHLETKQIEKIDNYMKENDLYKYIVEFSKGDSHQKLFDESGSDYFNYYNYPAISPSSDWVQTNFKKGMRGFEFFNYYEDGSKSNHPYKF